MKLLHRKAIQMNQSRSTLELEAQRLQVIYRMYHISDSNVQAKLTLERYNEIRRTLAIQHSLIIPHIESW